jgi:ER membrane protein complex subunit 4
MSSKSKRHGKLQLLQQSRELILSLNKMKLRTSLPMSAVMMWFSGSSIQIFSVMMTGTLFWSPLKALSSFPSGVFGNLETATTRSRLLMPKAIYVLCQLLSIVLGVIKLQWMGYSMTAPHYKAKVSRLLPTTRSDWLAWEVYNKVIPRCR